MLPRHRRRFGTYGEERRTGSRLLLRAAMALGVIALVWYVFAALVDLIDGSLGTKASALLTVRGGGVQVSLQENDWQPGESGLRLGAGDAVSTRGDGDALLTFFDGTRLRLAGDTRLTINESSEVAGETSEIDITVESGVLWAATPQSKIYTGAIVRTVHFPKMDITLPADTQAQLSATSVIALRAEDLGLSIVVHSDGGGASTLVVGEGQSFQLTPDALIAIERGSSPYDFRDPVTQEELRSPFLTSSFALLSTTPVSIPSPVNEGGDLQENEEGALLTITAPLDDASVATSTVKVSGTVASRVTTLLINGQRIQTTNGAFDADVNLPQGATTTIVVEGQDAQGITIARMERTVKSTYQKIVEPVRIKSPVGSGETLQTSATDIEITGEAPAGTEAIMVNDYRLQLFKPGSSTWSYLANIANGNLREGSNVFTIYALDREGNRSVGRTITIVYSAAASGTGSIAEETPIKQNAPLEPGSLRVRQPTEGTDGETSLPELSILGTTSSSTHTVSVNGYTLSLYESGSTDWKYIASTTLGTMKRGRNVYRVVARNIRGEILDVLEYTLTFAP